MDYIKHLQKDAKLATILGEEVHQLQFHKNIPLRLIASIMSQQLSTKVAAVIFKRFLALFNDEEPTPAQIANTPFETLKAIGLSANKTNYILNVAHFCIEHHIKDTLLISMDNESIVKTLTQIKGVGVWTTEMLLMFSLGREDVFAVDDLGIQQAMQRLYGLDNSNTKSLKKEMQLIAEAWKPFRTYACLHLWKWKDAVPA